MARLFRKLKNFQGLKKKGQKEGSSMVSVIIGVVFLAAIGLTILTVATKYVVTVYVDRGQADNFYQTEGILTEIRTGLLEYAGDASEVAYKEILENYTKSSSTMKTKFAKKYFSGLIEKITGVSYIWDDSKLGIVQPCDLDKIKTLSRVPDAVTTLPGTNLGFVINYSDEKGYSLTLKNLLIDYTNPTEYRSTIQTDIVLKVPDYKFEGDSTLDALKDYIVISDDSLEITSGNPSAGAAFTGNVYTGNKDSGIKVEANNGAVFESQTIISRGSLDIFTGANVKLSGESGAGDCWLQNIRLKPGFGNTSKLSTQLTMNENAYIANDLDIEDNNSVVSLQGKYYGYSYNQENTASTVTARSDYSSAILVNGLNTTLKTDGLDKLILAGRTFVSRNDPADSSGATSSISDIMMGESLAVKSNQIAYLLPDEYIKAGHNPLMNGEDMTVYKDSLLASDIGKYLDSNEPYTANYNNKGMYVYYYLKFKDEKNANEYFRHYYAGTGTDEEGNAVSNKEQLDEKAQSYIATTDDTGMKLSPNLYLIAGNIIHNYYASGGSSIQNDNYYDNIGSPKGELLDDGKRIGQGYVGRQLTLLPSGATGSMRLPASAPALVADKIIDFSKVTGIIDKTDSKSGGRVHVVPGIPGDSNSSYTVDGTITKGIIIAGGDVKVSSDFTGLILARGKVTVTGKRNLNADIILTGNLMEFIKKDKDLAKIFRALNGSEKQDPTELSECISYQNWTKNED